MKKQESIIDLFPKNRADLPKEYQDIYTLHYKRNRDGKTKTTSLSMKMERWLHRQVALDLKNIDSESDTDTLEIGAGTLNHLKFEQNVKDYDIIEPFTDLFKNSDQLKRVKNVFSDILEIDNNTKYQRIISIATFEHIMDLPTIIAKVALLLKKEGVLRVSIPNEGTVVWKLGTLITGLEFKKIYGLDYQVLMKYEHVNTAYEIEEVLRYFFKETSIKVFGISKKLAFYHFICCKTPDVKKASEYLAKPNEPTVA